MKHFRAENFRNMQMSSESCFNENVNKSIFCSSFNAIPAGGGYFNCQLNGENGYSSLKDTTMTTGGHWFNGIC